MIITQIKNNKKEYLDLLLLADESEAMIANYLDRGDFFLLDDNGTKAVCVVTEEGDGVYEIQNVAVDSAYQRQGYGRALIKYVLEHYENRCSTMLVGTGDSPMTLPFYESCGFEYSHRIKNYMLEHYPHPIIENGVQLFDKVYLKKDFA